MANPNNSLGTNGAYGGRTSVNAFNDVLGAFDNRGIISGWGCTPSSGLTVEIGGNGSVRDVALAEDNIGNKTTVNNISQAPIPVVMPAAPANNSRVDSIVAYIESSPSTNAETDNYSAVHLLVVSGNTGTSPSAPSESEIRSAITADGASGSTAYYVVLANITIPAGTTDIDSTMIAPGRYAQNKPDLMERFGENIRATTIAAGYDSTMRLVRCGRLVFANGTFVINNVPALDMSDLNETMPYGFRPSGFYDGLDLWIPFTETNPTNSLVNGAWTILSNGRMKISTTTSWDTPRRFNYSACWTTEDD